MPTQTIFDTLSVKLIPTCPHSLFVLVFGLLQHLDQITFDALIDCSVASKGF